MITLGRPNTTDSNILNRRCTRDYTRISIEGTHDTNDSVEIPSQNSSLIDVVGIAIVLSLGQAVTSIKALEGGIQIISHRNNYNFVRVRICPA